MALEQVGYNSPDGSVQPGQHREVINCGTATVLKASDSGAMCVFDTAAGSLFTLPSAVAGMYFDYAFNVKTTGEYKLLTATGDFLRGTLVGTTTTTTNVDSFAANGTTHVSVSMDGGATGGDAGGYMRVVAISSTIWFINGYLYCGTTTPTDPFDTT